MHSEDYSRQKQSAAAATWSYLILWQFMQIYLLNTNFKIVPIKINHIQTEENIWFCCYLMNLHDFCQVWIWLDKASTHNYKCTSACLNKDVVGWESCPRSGEGVHGCDVWELCVWYWSNVLIKTVGTMCTWCNNNSDDFLLNYLQTHSLCLKSFFMIYSCQF